MDGLGHGEVCGETDGWEMDECREGGCVDWWVRRLAGI